MTSLKKTCHDVIEKKQAMTSSNTASYDVKLATCKKRNIQTVDCKNVVDIIETTSHDVIEFNKL